MATERPAPSLLQMTLAASAAAWISFVGWRLWTGWPRLSLDLGADSATEAAHGAAIATHLFKGSIVAVIGLALLLGVAWSLRKRVIRPEAQVGQGETWTGPARILLMRHAEKTGDLEDIHLSAAGVKRAERLATYIPETFGKPDFLFAAARSKRSIRSIETLRPLEAAIGVPLRFDIEDKEFPSLVEELLTDARYRGALVVVCWHHSKLPEIAAELGAPDGDYPHDWSEQTYNLIIDIDYRAGRPPTVKEIIEPF